MSELFKRTIRPSPRFAAPRPRELASTRSLITLPRPSLRGDAFTRSSTFVAPPVNRPSVLPSLPKPVRILDEVASVAKAKERSVSFSAAAPRVYEFEANSPVSSPLQDFAKALARSRVEYKPTTPAVHTGADGEASPKAHEYPEELLQLFGIEELDTARALQASFDDVNAQSMNTSAAIAHQPSASTEYPTELLQLFGVDELNLAKGLQLSFDDNNKPQREAADTIALSPTVGQTPKWGDTASMRQEQADTTHAARQQASSPSDSSLIELTREWINTDYASPSQIGAMQALRERPSLLPRLATPAPTSPIIDVQSDFTSDESWDLHNRSLLMPNFLLSRPAPLSSKDPLDALRRLARESIHGQSSTGDGERESGTDI